MLIRASAVQFGKTGQEMWTDVTLRQLELIVIFNLHQIQAIGMRCYATGTTDPALQHFLHPFHRPLASADGH